jgi:hypothetical protein
MLAGLAAAKQKDSRHLPRHQSPGSNIKDPLPIHLQALSRARPRLVRNVTIYDGEGGRIDGGAILFQDGKIVSLAGALADMNVPANAMVIDGTGKWVTPGIIDAHSHLGDYPSPAWTRIRTGMK